jgi:hypothetical protein
MLLLQAELNQDTSTLLGVQNSTDYLLVLLQAELNQDTSALDGV